MITINIYRTAGAWYGARWIDGEYDGCDELPVEGDASEAEARAAALTTPLTASGDRAVTRVRDDT